MSELIYDRIAVGLRIREKRTALHLTQENLAEKLEKSQRMITDLERGEVGMSIETLMQLCNTLKTTPNDLLLGREDDSDNELDWLLHALKHSSEHVRATAIDIVRTYLKSV